MVRKRNIQIAIVEDDKYYNMILTKYIRSICSKSFYPHFEFTIQSFENAHDFIEKFDKSVDIILLDYYLFNQDEDEQLNGGDVLSIIKSYHPECKVILLSSLTDASKIAEMSIQGLHAHVDKNISSRNRIGAILQKTLEGYPAHVS